MFDCQISAGEAEVPTLVKPGATFHPIFWQCIFPGKLPFDFFRSISCFVLFLSSIGKAFFPTIAPFFWTKHDKPSNQLGEIHQLSPTPKTWGTDWGTDLRLQVLWQNLLDAVRRDERFLERQRADALGKAGSKKPPEISQNIPKSDGHFENFGLWNGDGPR